MHWHSEFASASALNENIITLGVVNLPMFTASLETVLRKERREGSPDWVDDWKRENRKACLSIDLLQLNSTQLFQARTH